MVEVQSFQSESELIADAAARLAEQIRVVSARPFRLVLTGGTLGIALLERMQQLGVDPTGVDIYWGDERWVSRDHSERNEHQALTAWPLLQNANLHRFGFPETDDLAVAASNMNQTYERQLSQDPSFCFDLVLLGVGPDGHVASLFPGRPEVRNCWVVTELDSPKPPPVRLSFSYSALNAANRVWFLAAGEAKAKVVTEAILNQGESVLPCAKVNGKQQTMWFIDSEISEQLPPEA